MSIALSREDQLKVKEYLITYLRSNYGSDMALSDEGDDLQLIGGDFRMSGTFTGNALDDVRKLVADRINTRLLTSPAESAVLPKGYGSFISSLVGMSGEVDRAVLDKVIQTYIFSALINEPLIDIDTLQISTRIDIDGKIFVNLSVASGIIEVALNTNITG